MYLSDPNRVGGEHPLPDFWDTINRIAVTLNLSVDQIADMLEITPYRLRILLQARKEPPVSSAMALSNRINIGFDDLVLNQFDYKLMAQQYFGDHSALPEKYSRTGLSKRRAVIPFLDYIEKYFGWAQRAMVLRRFQMTEAMFTNPDSPISLKFTVDLIRYLSEYYRNPAIIEHMGWYSGRSGRNTPFGNGLAQARSAGEVYELACTELVPRYFEKNYSWRLVQLSDQDCVIEGKPSEELRSTQEFPELLTQSICTVRSGFVSSLPTYANLLTMKVQKSACVSQGDDVCLYHVRFPRSASA